MPRIDFGKIKDDIFKALQPEIEKAALDIQNQAKAITPTKTGALRDSIVVKNFKNGAVVTSKLRYAQHVEFGTYKDRPKPFMRKTYDANKVRVAAQLEKAVIAEVNKINKSI